MLSSIAKKKLILKAKALALPPTDQCFSMVLSPKEPITKAEDYPILPREPTPKAGDQLTDSLTNMILSPKQLMPKAEDQLTDSLTNMILSPRGPTPKAENQVADSIPLFPKNEVPPSPLSSIGSENEAIIILSEEDIIVDRLEDENKVQARMAKFATLPNYPQGSPEWLEQRNHFLTGSTIARALGIMGPATQRNLMIEKVTYGKQGGFFGSTSTRWGNKYEPVANAIYSERNGVTIHAFSMLTNPKYPILAISPDGILEDRMIEIKCPYSREITGKVKKDYAHQLQMQMAVCEYDQCDFLECGFAEFESLEAFVEAFNNTEDEDEPEKGVIVAYYDSENPTKDGTPRYLYSPIKLCQDRSGLDQWEQAQIVDLEAHPACRYHDSHYWQLEAYLCQSIKRDPSWIVDNYPKLEKFWADVELYRRIGVDKVPDYKGYLATIKKPVGCSL